MNPNPFCVSFSSSDDSKNKNIMETFMSTNSMKKEVQREQTSMQRFLSKIPNSDTYFYGILQQNPGLLNNWKQCINPQVQVSKEVLEHKLTTLHPHHIFQIHAAQTLCDELIAFFKTEDQCKEWQKMILQCLGFTQDCTGWDPTLLATSLTELQHSIFEWTKIAIKQRILLIP